MQRINQHIIDKICDKIFGTVKSNSDFTVFEFDRLLIFDNVNSLIGHIYRYENAENYYSIVISSELNNKDFLYITITKDNINTNFYIYDTKNDIIELDK